VSGANESQWSEHCAAMLSTIHVGQPTKKRPVQGRFFVVSSPLDLNHEKVVRLPTRGKRELAGERRAFGIFLKAI